MQQLHHADLDPNLIERRFDKEHNKMVARVDPGLFYVSQQDELVYTRLGSCVAACIWDPLIGVGGLNHFLLPEKKLQGEWQNIASYSCRYGNWAMEQLINGILKAGGSRSRLQAKVFGGAQIGLAMSFNVGQDNIEFVKHYLAMENIPIVSEDLGGDLPRKVLFHPQTGKALLKWLPMSNKEQVAQQENIYLSHLDTDQQSSSDIELF
ncbi:chemoreceptor glutamine deamidase CheD [Shewanella sp. WXL01]|uniref:Probable chemoreceptor glutamine deamidase CheD n=1 Tax=Shewanella maritima TaxID=2520507 RepID=A0A411PG71_9GAMM|nr:MULTISPECIES: chemoreceptor glutamine deamidase CheD [Shewanella]NKF49400.1 chemoreceptor glutamine deamidase CheD [Shewanella sp. WXL01]QBF82488.1 chemoreceptor glutamine deamidase CheD [Shewanella maritima]